MDAGAVTGVKRAKRPQMNIRRKKFVKNLVSGLGVHQSALRAGYAHANSGSALLREPAVLSALQTAMTKAGIDDEYLSSKIKEGLEATYPEKRAKDGSVLQAGAPDFFTRGQYLDKAFKVRGDYAPERHIEQKQVLTINVNMETIRGLKDCGVIDAEDITRLDGGNNVGASRPQGLLGNHEEGQSEGSPEEDRGEPAGVRQEI